MATNQYNNIVEKKSGKGQGEQTFPKLMVTSPYDFLKAEGSYLCLEL